MRAKKLFFVLMLRHDHVKHSMISSLGPFLHFTQKAWRLETDKIEKLYINTFVRKKLFNNGKVSRLSLFYLSSTRKIFKYRWKNISTCDMKQKGCKKTSKRKMAINNVL
jgi:hypothetical protein